MILAKNLRKGNTFMHEGKIQIVLENSLTKKARGSSITKLKVKSINDKAIRILTFIGDAFVKQVILEKIPFTCLYSDEKNYYFMNNKNYEQITIAKEDLKWEEKFLHENLQCEIVMHNGMYVYINLPDKIRLKVIQAEHATRGDTVNNPQKDVIVETNYQLKVPLFIKKGDYIMIKTTTGKYDGKG